MSLLNTALFCLQPVLRNVDILHKHFSPIDVILASVKAKSTHMQNGILGILCGCDDKVLAELEVRVIHDEDFISGVFVDDLLKGAEVRDGSSVEEVLQNVGLLDEKIRVVLSHVLLTHAVEDALRLGGQEQRLAAIGKCLRGRRWGLLG